MDLSKASKGLKKLINEVNLWRDIVKINSPNCLLTLINLISNHIKSMSSN